jgi:membrane-associated phospholipid phosphatase
VQVKRSTLTTIALVSLSSFALLGAVLANDRGLYGFDAPFLRSPGSLPSFRSWADIADLVGAPAIGVVLAVALAFGILRRSLARVMIYAGLAAVTFLVSEHVAKPLDHETVAGHLSFPSGRVTAVCATAVAMWLALYPLMGKWARGVTLFLGAAWVLLISVAVVGAHWHTPFDALGSVLLSLGILAAGAAVYESLAPHGAIGPVDADASFLAGEGDAALTSNVRGSG